MIYTYLGITDAICSAGRSAAQRLPELNQGVKESSSQELSAAVDAMVEAMGKCIASGRTTIHSDELSDPCNEALAQWNSRD